MKNTTTLTWRQGQRVQWIERELLQCDVDVGNAESSLDYDKAEEVDRYIDRLERELASIYR